MNGLKFENKFHFQRISFGKHCHCIPVLIVRGNQSHWVITLWSSFLIKAIDNFLCLQVDKVYNIYYKSGETCAFVMLESFKYVIDSRGKK